MRCLVAPVSGSRNFTFKIHAKHLIFNFTGNVEDKGQLFKRILVLQLIF